jgi:hypothetical protein
MRNIHRWILGGVLVGAIIAVPGCASEEGDDELPPPDMSSFAGTWQAMMAVVWENTCPLTDAVVGGTGYYFVIDELDETTGEAVACSDEGGPMDCDYRGPIVLAGEHAMYVNTHEFGPYYGLDCVYAQRQWGLFTRGANDDLVGELTAIIYEVEGTECRALENILKMQSGKDVALAGCEMSQTIGFVRR